MTIEQITNQSGFADEHEVKERLFYGHAAIVLSDLDQCVGNSWATFPNWHANHFDTIKRLFIPGVKTILASDRGYDSIAKLAIPHQVTAFYPEAGASSAWKATNYRAINDNDPILTYIREKVLPKVDIHVYEAAAQLVLDKVIEKFAVANYRCYYFNPDRARQQGINTNRIKELMGLSVEKLRYVVIDGSPIIDVDNPLKGHLIASHDSAFNLHPSRTRISKMRVLNKFAKEAAEYGLEIHGRPLIFIEDKSADWLNEAKKQFGTQAFFAIPANASEEVHKFAKENLNSGNVFVSDQPYAHGVIDAYSRVLKKIKFHQSSQNVYSATF